MGRLADGEELALYLSDMNFWLSSFLDLYVFKVFQHLTKSLFMPSSSIDKYCLMIFYSTRENWEILCQTKSKNKKCANVICYFENQAAQGQLSVCLLLIFKLLIFFLSFLLLFPCSEWALIHAFFSPMTRVISYFSFLLQANPSNSCHISLDVMEHRIAFVQNITGLEKKGIKIQTPL